MQPQRVICAQFKDKNLLIFMGFAKFAKFCMVIIANLSELKAGTGRGRKGLLQNKCLKLICLYVIRKLYTCLTSEH